MTKQEELSTKPSEKIYNEFKKGFLDFVVYGIEVYRIEKDVTLVNIPMSKYIELE